jgi:hypothetical protein
MNLNKKKLKIIPSESNLNHFFFNIEIAMRNINTNNQF